jgi:adenylate cyclase
MLGLLGGSSMMEGTVISEAVDLPSRLETLSKAVRIKVLISEHTYHGLKDGSSRHLRYIDHRFVKGKNRPHPTYLEGHGSS